MQSLIPVVMSGIIAVYALVVAVLIAGNMRPPPEMQYSAFNGFLHLACGLSVGLTGLAAGYAIGIVGDSILGRARVHAAIANLCGHGPHLDFRRSSWTLRVRRASWFAALFIY
jgi:F0F1-type ATP synthase membrane subunit c/vacuolar-type H+-ATPase subunit K